MWLFDLRWYMFGDGDLRGGGRARDVELKVLLIVCV